MTTNDLVMPVLHPRSAANWPAPVEEIGTNSH